MDRSPFQACQGEQAFLLLGIGVLSLQQSSSNKLSQEVRLLARDVCSPCQADEIWPAAVGSVVLLQEESQLLAELQPSTALTNKAWKCALYRSS